MLSTVITGHVLERSALAILARIEGHDGQPVRRTDLSTIAYEVWDIEAEPVARVVSQTALTIATVIFDTLQTGAPWSADATGYNFKANLPAASLPDAHVYRIDVRFTPVAGEPFFAAFEVEATKVYFGD